MSSSRERGDDGFSTNGGGFEEDIVFPFPFALVRTPWGGGGHDSRPSRLDGGRRSSGGPPQSSVGNRPSSGGIVVARVASLSSSLRL